MVHSLFFFIHRTSIIRVGCEPSRLFRVLFTESFREKSSPEMASSTELLPDYWSPHMMSWGSPTCLLIPADQSWSTTSKISSWSSERNLIKLLDLAGVDGTRLEDVAGGLKQHLH